MINGKVLAINKSLKSKTPKSIFTLSFPLWCVNNWGVSHQWHRLWTLPLFSVFPATVQGRALVVSLSEYCSSHPCSAFCLLVQMLSATRVSSPKGSLHCPAFGVHLSPVLSWDPEHTVFSHLFAFTPAIFWPWKGIFKLLSLLFTYQNHPPFLDISSDTTAPITVMKIRMHSAAGNRALSSSCHML